MKKTLTLGIIGVAAVMLSLCSGCMTSATALTETTFTDGRVTKSLVKIIGTGDKASQVAAEGMFADGTPEDLGAGVKNAAASQASSGIDGTLKGMGEFMGGLGQFVQAVQAAKTGGLLAQSAVTTAEYATSPPAVTSSTATTTTAPTSTAEIAYDDFGFNGAPSADGSGVYGKPECGRCRAYKAANPAIELIDLNNVGYKAVMWKRLKAFKYTGDRVSLPVTISPDGYKTGD